MSNLYFLETRFFKEHFSLLRRFHLGHTSRCFSHSKFWTPWGPLLIHLSLLLLLPHVRTILQLILPSESWEENSFFPFAFPLHALPRGHQMKIWSHLLLPLNSRTPLILFSWWFQLGYLSFFPISSCLASFRWDLFSSSLIESFELIRNVFFTHANPFSKWEFC